MSLRGVIFLAVILMIVGSYMTENEQAKSASIVATLQAENAELRETIAVQQPTVTPERSYFANQDGSCPGWIKTEELTVWLDANRTQSFGTVKRGQQVNIMAWTTGPDGMLNVNIPSSDTWGGDRDDMWIEFHGSNGYVSFAYPCPTKPMENVFETPVPVTPQPTALLCRGWIGESEEKLWTDERQIDLQTILNPGEEVSVIGRGQTDMIFVIHTAYNGQRFYGWLWSGADITVESSCTVPGFKKE